MVDGRWWIHWPLSAFFIPRSGSGRAKWIFSSFVSRVSIVALKWSLSRATHRCTTASGALAPAVTATVSLPAEPVQIYVFRPVDKICRDALRSGHFGQALTIRTVAAAHDDYHVRPLSQHFYSLLPMLGGIADVRPGRTDNMRKSLPKAVDHRGGIVYRQCGLSQVSDLVGIGYIEADPRPRAFASILSSPGPRPSCPLLRRDLHDQSI